MGQIYSSKCQSNARLDGKTVVITGANTGIGKESANDLFKRGATVILACRNVTKANLAVNDILKQSEGHQNLGQLKVVELNLSSMKSVRECAEILLKEKEINILVNNAGVFGVPLSKTEDGFELTFQSNHLGHFLLTLLLMPLLRRSTPVRIINVTSSLHSLLWDPLDLTDLNFENRKFSSLRAYNESKLCNILFTAELARKLKASNMNGINVYAVHPGAVKTEAGRYLDQTYFSGLYWIWANVIAIFYKSAEQGAQTTIYCCVDEKCSTETGLYYAECKLHEPSAYAKDEKLADELWKLSLKYVGLEEYYDPFSES